MKILILSDSHYKSLNDINFKEYDYILHAGDYGISKNEIEENGIIYVKGNCDIEGLNEVSIEIDNKKFLITHGHLYDVKYDLTRLLFKGLSQNANFVIYGHTHIANIVEEEGIIFINPGSYQDGYYAVIDDHQIAFYKDGKDYKIFRRKW